MKLETENFTNNQRDPDYEGIQIRRHESKASKQEDSREYDLVSDGLRTFYQFGKDQTMVCLGTRNNHERDVFASNIPEVKVYSLDISPQSGADFIMDFTTLPDDWTCKWDLIYSNSIDHSYDPTQTFAEWLRTLKTGGIMMLGMNYGTIVSPTDISSFRRYDVTRFLKSRTDINIHGKVRSITNEESETWYIEKLENR